MQGTYMKRLAGYRYLRVYQLLVIIFDLTEQFIRKFLPGSEHRRTRDQMFQAARSSKQCLLEGYSQEGLKGYIKLSGIAKGSNEELHEDYLDFLRQRSLRVWGRYDPRIYRLSWVSRVCREIEEGKIPTIPTLPTNGEYSANLLLDLTAKAGYLLDRLIKALIEKHRTEGGLTERLYSARIEYRRKHLTKL